jgi:glucose-1-phosphate cytidylyltransferase
MKVVILAGGYGTRISEESHLKPKPMIEIGGKPILWHIMKIYSHFGYHDFVICLGYKGYSIKEYFANYFLHNASVTLDFRGTESARTVHNHSVEPWRVTLVETGVSTMTGGRLKAVQDFVGNEAFMLTYGDGVSDVNIDDLVAAHKNNKKLCTVTATQPIGRFGAMDLSSEGLVNNFQEKPKGDGAWINSGFFVMEPEVFKYLEGPDTILEQKPLVSLAKQEQLHAYRHTGFWQPMDTLRDKVHLEQLIEANKAPWITWNKES